ncbi:MAG: aminotransferase class V-fold PLP-dependent enzyme, partial [Chlamydiota bacterium]|nr:aminotransferase class V-fold PLP-dependent enzyme [Chlamydiota bacterium]
GSPYASLLEGVYLTETLEEGRNHIITLGGGWETPKRVWEKSGLIIRTLSPSLDGQMDFDELNELLGPRTALVSLPFGDSLTGYLYPVEAIAHLCEERGILLHLSAEGVMGKLPIHLGDIPCSSLSLSIGGGVGAIILPWGWEPPSLALHALESGHERVLGYCVESAKRAEKLGMEASRLTSLLETHLREGLPIGRSWWEDTEKMAGVSLWNFPGIASELLAFRLNQQGIPVGWEGLADQLIAWGGERSWAESMIALHITGEEGEESVKELATSIIQEVVACQPLIPHEAI